MQDHQQTSHNDTYYVVLTHHSECKTIVYQISSMFAEVVLTHHSECKTILMADKKFFKVLYLPIIQNARPSIIVTICFDGMLYLPIIQNARPSAGHLPLRMWSCTYPSFRMQDHPRDMMDGGAVCCTYPSFRMQDHPQISIILNNRHLLNIRALLFLLHNI